MDSIVVDKQNKTRVIFDCDSVLIDTINIISNLYINEYYQEIISGLIPTPLPMYVKKWGMEDEFPLMTIQKLDEYFTSDLFFLNRQYICDPNGFSVKDLFEELAHDNNYLVGICTKGSQINLDKKLELFKNELSGFNEEYYFPILGTDFGKGIISAEIAVDDVVANLVSMVNVKHKILFANRGLDCEWNKNYKDYPYIHVATSVGELNKLISKLSK
jgi:hypothetical protein